MEREGEDDSPHEAPGVPVAGRGVGAGVEPTAVSTRSRCFPLHLMSLSVLGPLRPSGAMSP